MRLAGRWVLIADTAPELVATSAAPVRLQLPAAALQRALDELVRPR